MTSIGKFSPNELNHIRLSSDQSNQGIGLTGSMNTSRTDAHFETKCDHQFSGAGTQTNRILDPERISSPQIASPCYHKVAFILIDFDTRHLPSNYRDLSTYSLL